jgi:hypothetical protein
VTVALDSLENLRSPILRGKGGKTYNFGLRAGPLAGLVQTAAGLSGAIMPRGAREQPFGGTFSSPVDAQQFEQLGR